jgi:hypothetical protein
MESRGSAPAIRIMQCYAGIRPSPSQRLGFFMFTRRGTMFVGNDRRITMDRNILLQKLKENLDTHQTEFTQALANWKDAARAYAVDVLERVNLNDFSDLSFTVPRPQDSSNEINRAIEMVEYSTELEIVLDENTFRQWVSGEWSFRNRLHESLFASSEYVGNLRKK